MNQIFHWETQQIHQDAVRAAERRAELARTSEGAAPRQTLRLWLKRQRRKGSARPAAKTSDLKKAS